MNTYTWECSYCGQPFETHSYTRRYCSRAHQPAAYRLRKSGKRRAIRVRAEQVTP